LIVYEKRSVKGMLLGYFLTTHFRAGNGQAHQAASLLRMYDGDSCQCCFETGGGYFFQVELV
jgi:hypothetical protein